MAIYRKRGKPWEVSVCHKGIRRSSTHPPKTAAALWAFETIAEIDAGASGRVVDKPFSALHEKCRDEVSVTKRGERWERSRIGLLLRVKSPRCPSRFSPLFISRTGGPSPKGSLGCVSPPQMEPTEPRDSILIGVIDGLKGFPEAIEAAFPLTTVQTCIVHLIRNSLDYVSWKDRKSVAAALKPIYTAPTEAAAQESLAAFEDGVWGQKHRPSPPLGAATGSG